VDNGTISTAANNWLAPHSRRLVSSASIPLVATTATQVDTMDISTHCQRWTLKARDARRITAAEMKYMWRTAGYIWTDYKTNTQIAKELKITQILDKLLEYNRNWIQHVNRMPRNRLPRVMKRYSATGRRNHGRPLKRLLDAWDRNESTSGPTPWQIHDVDDGDVSYRMQRQHLSLIDYIDYIDFMRRARWKSYQETSWMQRVGNCLSIL